MRRAVFSSDTLGSNPVRSLRAAKQACSRDSRAAAEWKVRGPWPLRRTAIPITAGMEVSLVMSKRKKS
jgi:hypothetical protein